MAQHFLISQAHLNMICMTISFIVWLYSKPFTITVLHNVVIVIGACCQSAYDDGTNCFLDGSSLASWHPIKEVIIEFQADS